MISDMFFDIFIAICYRQLLLVRTSSSIRFSRVVDWNCADQNRELSRCFAGKTTESARDQFDLEKRGTLSAFQPVLGVSYFKRVHHLDNRTMLKGGNARRNSQLALEVSTLAGIQIEWSLHKRQSSRILLLSVVSGVTWRGNKVKSNKLFHKAQIELLTYYWLNGLSL